MRHTFNTIPGGFAGGTKTIFGRRVNAHQILNIEDIPNVEGEGESNIPEAIIAFLETDVYGIQSHNDDTTITIVRCDECEIKRVLVDQRSSTYILYWDAF